MSGYQRLSREQEDFPKRLREMGSWPQELHCHGPLLDDGISVSIVGSRAASGVGMKAAYDLAVGLALAGHRVISGGALGIDAAAHRGALAGSGYTLAVMACGLNCYYPKRNAYLFERIRGAGGAIISPFAFGCQPLPANFVRRNQIIAALADLVVIVEAGTRSGSLHTARFASRLGRKLVAFPGSSGCQSLCARGVCPVEGIDDVLAVLTSQYSAQRTSRWPAPESLEGQVLHQLSDTDARGAGDVAAALGISYRRAQQTLLALEADSLVCSLPGARYRCF